MPCARLSWPYRQLLSGRKYIVSYRIVSYQLLIQYCPPSSMSAEQVYDQLTDCRCNWPVTATSHFMDHSKRPQTSRTVVRSGSNNKRHCAAITLSQKKFSSPDAQNAGGFGSCERPSEQTPIRCLSSLNGWPADATSTHEEQDNFLEDAILNQRALHPTVHCPLKAPAAFFRYDHRSVLGWREQDWYDGKHRIEQLCLVTLTVSIGKRDVTVWRPSICPSVCLSRWHTHRDSSGGSIHRGQRTFRPDSKEDRQIWYIYLWTCSLLITMEGIYYFIRVVHMRCSIMNYGYFLPAFLFVSYDRTRSSLV